MEGAGDILHGRPRVAGIPYLDGDGRHRRSRLGLDTSAELFGDASHQLHSTSALRYPVLIEGSNYRGSPQIGRSPLLTEIVSANLPYELKQLPNALIVPLGKAVEGALALICWWLWKCAVIWRTALVN